ncbi:2-polyprenyl-3-methyl-5-hydroxy-6-metoxy-1,4-benzoquinol methylase [Butyrivibrio proteoclasticus]|uniref:2-polyprenyl-3-methyl-5-hydroxy-6-metoxy-1,4-benzoquinol methylase n=1 Tax=Butyrivibrio proteoclasticus TaxID=43305 RepID=A0A1I5WQW9_9FIRM|nr:class I SAM-dependent methyltransferase [Butyrivibrio proteoclasticus]SFQ22163.1 2-polyprenyl-3-methyl-5-hydroxy-6-metoxy-1,4-benzoquinol methylase [Butyrivibrio proteoclasticus]
MSKIIEKFKFQANSHNSGGMANKLRKKRMMIFEGFIEQYFSEELKNNKQIKVLDIGGDITFWQSMGCKYFDQMDITLLNIDANPFPNLPVNVKAVVGNALDMQDISDKEYDICFSNSCIEHVGKEKEWAMMAKEMKRAGKHYFLQTPNRYFPIEPHFLVPFFQFFPLKLKASMINKHQLGFWPQGKDWEDSLKIADEIKLLSYRNLRTLFPEAEIKREMLGGLTKSYMVYK